MKALLLVKVAAVFEAGFLLSVVSAAAIAQDTLPTIDQPASVEMSANQNNGAETRIVLSIRDRTVSLFSGDILINSYPVAVGTDETPTPTGQFTVSQMIVEPVWQSPWTGEFHAPGPNSALGLRWIGFSTTSSGSFGFHGTPTLNSIGKAASNGCVRMRNEDVVALFEQVDVGTPVTVLP